MQEKTRLQLIAYLQKRLNVSMKWCYGKTDYQLAYIADMFIEIDEEMGRNKQKTQSNGS